MVASQIVIKFSHMASLQFLHSYTSNYQFMKCYHDTYAYSQLTTLTLKASYIITNEDSGKPMLKLHTTINYLPCNNPHLGIKYMIITCTINYEMTSCEHTSVVLYVSNTTR